MSGLVTAWPNKYVRGRREAEGERYPSRPALEVLEAVYESDAHFWPGFELGQESCQRQRKGDYSTDARLSLLVFDVDAPDRQPSRLLDWWEGQRALIENVGIEGKEPAWYRTSGGYRLLWRLASPQKPDAYEAFWARCKARLGGQGIDVDEATSDWTRCYRLPRVVRDGYQQAYPLDLSPLETGAIGVREGGSFELDFGAVERFEPFQLPPVLEEGFRNQTLTQFAGALVRQGATPEQVRAHLQEVNEGQPEPLPEAEVLRIAQSSDEWDRPVVEPVLRAPEVEDLVGTGTEAPVLLGNSDAQVRDHVAHLLSGGDPSRLVYTRSTLHVYAPGEGVFKQLDTSAVRVAVMGLDGQPVMTPQGQVRAFKGQQNQAKAVASALEDLVHDRRFFEGATCGVCTRSGFVKVDPRTGEVVLENWSPEHRALHKLDVEWSQDGRGEPKMWLETLRSVWPEGREETETKIAALQEFFGASLVGIATKFQKALVLVGGGANGKSTVQTVMRSLFAADSVTNLTPQQLANRSKGEYYLARLAGALLNMHGELPASMIQDGEVVKAVISGDPISARHAYGQVFEFKPRAGHCVAANTLPPTLSNDHGFFRRWIVLRFDRAFAPHEQKPNLARDIIEKERGEILAWALRGVARLIARDGYTVPASSRDMLKQWRELSDSVVDYLGSVKRIEDDEIPARGTPARVLYADYMAWCEANGHTEKVNNRQFAQRLLALNVTKRRTSGAVMYGLDIQTV